MTELVVIGGIFREWIPATGGPSVRRAGGSGYVAALTAAALGAKVALVSFVGEEDSGAALTTLNRAGVDTSAVQILPGASGIFAFEDIADRQARSPHSDTGRDCQSSFRSMACCRSRPRLPSCCS